MFELRTVICSARCENCPEYSCGCERAIPLLGEEGWMRLKKISRSLISAADGVVEPAERCQHSRPPRPLR
jgi:hypothetical protein